MDVRRHITSGRLSEMFGSTTLETDEYVRTLGWRRTAARAIPRLQPRTREALQAYADGVNAYVNSHSLSHMSLEYTPPRSRWARLPPRTLDAGRLAELARGDGVGPPRQHGRRDRPGARPPGSHARAGGPALPGLRLPAAPADRRPGRGRPRDLPAGGDRARDAQPRATVVRRGGARRPAPAGSRARAHPAADGPRQRHRQQQLGRRRRPHDHGRAAAGQRPAPRRQHPRHLDADRPALQGGRGALPAGRLGLHLLRSARCGARSQRPHRVGLHQPGPRRVRPVPRAGPAATKVVARRPLAAAARTSRDDSTSKEPARR